MGNQIGVYAQRRNHYNHQLVVSLNRTHGGPELAVFESCEVPHMGQRSSAGQQMHRCIAQSRLCRLDMQACGKQRQAHPCWGISTSGLLSSVSQGVVVDLTVLLEKKKEKTSDAT